MVGLATDDGHRVNSHPHHNGAGTLEQRATAALTDPSIGAGELAELVVETEKGIADAEIIAERLQQVALDPVCSPDAAKAQATAELAVLICKRLRHLLPRLQQKHQALVSQQRRARWNEAADLMQTNRDFLAAEFAECVPQWTAKLLELFQRVLVMAAEIENLNGLAPSSESRRLEGIGHQHLLANTKLLNLAGEALWPPPQAPILPQDVMPILPGPGPDWHQTLLDRDREQYAESQRVSAFYAKQARDREDAENAAARAARGLP